MSEEIITRHTRDNMPLGTGTDWDRLNAMTEEEIEANALSDPDNPPHDSNDFWERGVAVHGARRLTRVNIDPDILAWFQEQGADFRQQIGEVLQAYIQTHEHTEPSSRDKFDKEAP